VGLPTLFPAERTTKVRAPALPDELGLADRFTSIPVRVTLSDDSRLTLDSPPNAIGETFPSATRGAGPGDTERFELPMPGYAKAVELDVRNHLFRHAVLVPVVDLTVWAPFAWLVAVAAAMISEGARAFLTRGWRRLLGRASPRLRPSS
jgi:hypothetical protein